jgi:hypothetical protein
MSDKKFDRLKIKHDLLNRKDPVLSYIHLEIINAPATVHSTLVEALDTGQMELTDDLFFECLEDSPDYLAFEPFRKRINDWQEALKKRSTPTKEKRGAKKNLERIGRTFAQEPRGRPSTHDDDVFLYLGFLETVEPVIQQFLNETKGKHQKKRIDNFKQRFPHWKDYADALKSRRSALEIAKAMLIIKYGISKRELQYTLKSVTRLRNLHNPDK